MFASRVCLTRTTLDLLPCHMSVDSNSTPLNAHYNLTTTHTTQQSNHSLSLGACDGLTPTLPTVPVSVPLWVLFFIIPDRTLRGPYSAATRRLGCVGDVSVAWECCDPR